MDSQSSLKKRVRDDSADSELDSVEVKRLREDLLGFLDDSDPDPSTQDLDLVMKSLEEEISTASCSATSLPTPLQAELAPAPVMVVDLTSDSGESQPDLDYLLEASDDELGLPPSNSSEEALKEETELVRVSSDSSGIGGEFWGFDDHQIPSYGSFELGTGDNFNDSDEYVAFDGLFGYSDVYFDSSDFSDLSWRSETMPAQ
ncbi:hypothetical protein PanWU01x14_285270 [Parasponia andersonii]|uniref:Uncharacterized protein n=1 Tax=Parasponia andersonii TaxID=3476 RepID=A0A2P5AZQ5_PARAD|nr:hypothetical protein PanWU01x14_285270 [Parasponia andersonii]